MNDSIPVDILVVEDNDSERDSIVEALEASLPDAALLALRDGEQALDYLFRRGEWTDRSANGFPKLILLDLAMPRADGFSVLAKVRSQDAEEALMLTPVVIFSDSHVTADISRSYRLGANSFVIKPVSFSDFQGVVKTVADYWMTHNRLDGP